MRRWACFLGAGALALGGCSRAWYRDNADHEVYPVIGQHVVAPEYALGDVTVEPKPGSRIADVTNPDFPAKPPDDPAAALFMARPGGFRGARDWGKDGFTDSVEPPDWESCLGLSPGQTLKLDQFTATEIALDNSREYQTQIETVYLTALGLTLNRFEFQTRYFARTASDLARVGASALPTERNALTTGSSTGGARNFAAGGQLLVDFTNSFVWEFTGKNQSIGGVFSASLIQPLLRGFGRKVRLESLTQAERDVLYAVRNYARFRKQFWAGVNVDGGGYLQIMNAIQAVRNAEANLKNQQENYALYQKLFEGGRTELANVDQIYQGLLSARRNVIVSEIQLQSSLDAFKLRLGLPPRLPVELDDGPLDRFVLVDPDTEKLRSELDAFEKARNAELGAPPPVAVLRDAVTTLERYAERAEKAVTGLDDDLGRWKADLATSPAAGDDPESRARAKQAYDRQATQPKELAAALKKLRVALTRLPTELSDTTRQASWEAVIALGRDTAAILDAAITAQSQARVYAIKLPDVPWTEPDALAFAHDNRLDLQNALGNVTDAWRQVTVAANALQSDLTLRADGALVTKPTANNPVDFANDFSRISLGVQFDGPLNRQAERNAYRASQIGYQRARRAYMATSDGVEFDIRNGLRGLRQSRVGFEIARQQLLVAVRQLALERRNLTRPVQAGQGGGFDANATLRILNAQNQLLSARNELAGNFFGYEQQRIRFLIDLEALTLDSRGRPTNADSTPPSIDHDGRPGPAAEAAPATPGDVATGGLPRPRPEAPPRPE